MYELLAKISQIFILFNDRRGFTKTVRQDCEISKELPQFCSSIFYLRLIGSNTKATLCNRYYVFGMNFRIYFFFHFTPEFYFIFIRLIYIIINSLLLFCLNELHRALHNVLCILKTTLKLCHFFTIFPTMNHSCFIGARITYAFPFFFHIHMLKLCIIYIVVLCSVKPCKL